MIIKSFAQASGAQRTEGELCAAAGAGRTRAAEGNNRQENFSPLKSDGPHFSFREKSWRADVFRNRSGNRIKVVVWDGTGVWLCQRRLHKGRFIWPKVSDACFLVTFEQWQWLITGVDWQRLSAVPSAHWQV